MERIPKIVQEGEHHGLRQRCHYLLVALELINFDLSHTIIQTHANVRNEGATRKPLVVTWVQSSESTWNVPRLKRDRETPKYGLADGIPEEARSSTKPTHEPLRFPKFR